MVEIADIKDRGSLEAWLNDQPREVAVWIAARAAARVLPVWWYAVLTEDWARKGDLTALPVLRSLLISSVAAKMPTEDLSAAASAAARVTSSAVARASPAAAARDSAAAAARDSAAAAYKAVAAADYIDADHTAARASSSFADFSVARVSAAAAYAAAAAANIWAEVRADAVVFEGGRDSLDLALWSTAENPLAGVWAKVQQHVAKAEDTKSAANWAFWIAWYHSLLDGRPMLGNGDRTWEMLAKIARIEPEVWDQGAEVVNPRVNGIWELFRLRIEAEELRAEKEAFLAARATPEQRSHNQPPGLVEAEPEAARQVTIIWAGLDEASEELEAEEPDKRRLQQIAERLLAALRAVAVYCGKVADAAVMAAAKVVGTAFLDHVANNGRLMQFAKDLLTWSGGGG